MYKFKIDFRSMIRKSPPKLDEDYLDSLICGYQGSGKSYFGIYNIEKYLQRKPIVYTNIKTYKSKTHTVKLLEDIERVYEIENDYNCIFILDECAKHFPKDCKIDKKFYGWLQQSRKHNRHVFMIFQEYIMVPNWIRGVCNKVYTTYTKFGLCFTDVGIPILDKETYEWGIDNLGTYIYKRNKSITNLYDTRESI